MSEASSRNVQFRFELVHHVTPDSAEALQSGGGEHVEPAHFSSGGGAVWGCTRGSRRCALHGPKAW